MKEILFFIIGFWFAFGNISAQSEQKNSLPDITQFNNEAEIFKYWARRFNVKYTFAYIQDYVKNHPKKTKEKGGWNKINDEFEKIDPNNVSEFNDFYNKYLTSENSLFKKNNWEFTGNKFINFNIKIDEEIKNGSFDFDNLKNSIIIYKKKDKKDKFDNSDIFKKIKDAYLTNKDTFREIIKNKLTELKKEKEQTPKEITDSKKTTPPFTHSTDNSNPIQRNYGSVFFSYIIWFLVGAITMYFLIFFKIKRVLHIEYNKYKAESEFNFNKDWFPFIPIIKYLKTRKEELKYEITEKEKEIKLLKPNLQTKKTAGLKISDKENNFFNTKEQSDNTEKKRSLEINNNDQSYISVKKNTPTTEIVYFSIPEPDGSFKVLSQSKTFHPKYYYKITYKKDEKIGDIEYISDDRHDIRSINYYDTYLKPVCIIKNLEKRMSANFVKMLKPGKVFLNDNKWYIQPNHKIEVEFV